MQCLSFDRVINIPAKAVKSIACCDKCRHASEYNYSVFDERHSAFDETHFIERLSPDRSSFPV